MSGYQCFHCGAYAVGWDADFDFADMMLEGEGIVHMCHCSNCGAQIEYYVPISNIERICHEGTFSHRRISAFGKLRPAISFPVRAPAADPSKHNRL